MVTSTAAFCRRPHAASLNAGFCGIRRNSSGTGSVAKHWSHWSAFRDWRMIKITLIEPRGFYRLLLRFSDGSEGERDFSDLVAEAGSLAKPLRDPAYFARAFTEDGTGLAWPNG